MPPFSLRGVSMFGGDGEKRFSLVGATVKTVIVVAGMSWFAAHWMSSATDRQGLAQMAGRISRGEDPTTTGSIAARANATKIDPCTVPRR